MNADPDPDPGQLNHQIDWLNYAFPLHFIPLDPDPWTEMNADPDPHH